jgi:hypothetical protein
VVYQDNWLHHSRNDRTSKRGLRFDRAQHICSGLENNTVRCSTIEPCLNLLGVTD